MSDDRHGEGTPRGGGRWDPLPQGEYDDGATAFVELPEGGVDALLAADSPLAAPGHGYVPPQITVSPATTAGTDPAATGSWPVPGGPADGAQWHEPHAAPGQQGHDVPEPPYGPDPSYGTQTPYGSPAPYASAAPYDPGAGQHGTGQHGDDRFTYEPGSTGQWAYEEPGTDGPAPGHDVTGQWSIPVAQGDLPDESGEFTTSSLVEQWGAEPPATLPGGAPAPWATQAAGQPWGQQALAGPGQPGADHGTAPEHGVAPDHTPEERPDANLPGPAGHRGDDGDHANHSGGTHGGHAGARGGHARLPQDLAAPHGTHTAPDEDLTGSPDPHAAFHGGRTAPVEHRESGAAAPHGTQTAEDGHGHPGDPHGPSGYAPRTRDAGPADGTGHAPDEPGAEAPGPGHGTAGQPSRPEGHGADAAAHGPFGPHTHAPDDAARGTFPDADADADAETGTPGQDRPGHAPEASDGPGPAPDPESPQDAEGPQGAQEAAEHAPGTAEPPARAEDASEAPESADGAAEPTAGTSPAQDGAPDPAGDGAPDGPAPEEAGPTGAHETGAPGESATAPQEEHPLASFVLRVNGADRPVTEAWIGESLLYVLRERLGLAGAKDGCSQGECGACNVQVDGRLVASCLVPAVTAAGSEVRTVEGLAEDGQPSDVQRALARCGAVQCGFCIPGMAMTVHDLLEGNPAPTELETRQALCGNLCRCSGYRGVVEAVKEVVAEREALAAPAEADGDQARIPHQAGPGAGGVNASAFGAPPQPHAPGPHPSEPHDQPYGQDGGPA
ncbi:2Fe-2S iron-sulfur cluster-binding protein [Streptomyces sp. NPDC017943]|uniref:2Fe-2S iron-sulfur cluster-binding protein n=1 Tax=Streptomyces sp. NPDC017943 TaxID=3365019 RepID=UPI003797A496